MESRGWQIPPYYNGIYDIIDFRIVEGKYITWLASMKSTANYWYYCIQSLTDADDKKAIALCTNNNPISTYHWGNPVSVANNIIK